jgi:hypothetical protein
MRLKAGTMGNMVFSLPVLIGRIQADDRGAVKPRNRSHASRAGSGAAKRG